MTDRRASPASPAIPTPLLHYLAERATGSYPIDEFGYDPEFTDAVLAPLLRPLYRDWFRVQLRGIEHVPGDGPALIVGNHSGTLPVDALMTALAVRDHHPSRRVLRLLAADLVFALPFLGVLARRGGATLACRQDVERLLDRGELVGVWPEGFKGIGKLFEQRYKLQRFGRGGFVSAALRKRVPIVPCAIVGAEEAYPMLADAAPLARLLKLPYFPITPTFPWLGPLGLVPLPSRWIIAFGEPIDTAGYPDGAADDPMVVLDLADRVRETIQASLDVLVEERGPAF